MADLPMRLVFVIEDAAALAAGLAALWVLWGYSRRPGEWRVRPAAVDVARFLWLFVLVGVVLEDGLENRVGGESPVMHLPSLGHYLTRLPALLDVAVPFAALVLLGLFAILARRVRGGRQRTTATVCWATVLVVPALAGLAHADAAPPGGWPTYLSALAATEALLLAALVLDARDVLRMLRDVSVAAVVSSLLADLVAPEWARTTFWEGGFIGRTRLDGVFPQPNVLGFVAAGCLLLILAHPYPRRALNVVTPGLALVALFLSGSRGATLALAAALVSVLIWRWSRTAYLVGIVILALLSPLLVFGLPRTASFLTGRGDYWSTALGIWQGSPWIGRGPWPTFADGVASAVYAHNQMLQSLAEGGLVGLTVLLATVTVTTYFVFRHGTGGGAALWTMLIVVASVENPERAFSLLFVVPAVQVLVGVLSTVEGPRRRTNRHQASSVAALS